MTNDKKQAENTQEDAAQSQQTQPQSDETPPKEDENVVPLNTQGDEFDELPPEPMELLEMEIADLKDRYIRLAADMENLRKRTERERQDTKKYAISEFARDILNLSDNFERAIDAVPAEAAQQDEVFGGFLDGIKMNERELQKVLERHGVQKTNPKGEKFDPNHHQAVQQIENSDLPNNTVVEVFQVGYMIADRVLRPAVVSVAKGGPKEAALAPQAAASEPVPEPEPEADSPGDDSGEIGSNIDKNA